MIYSTFTTALPGRPSAIGCALRRLAFPLDPHMPEFVTQALETLGAQRRSVAFSDISTKRTIDSY